MRLSRFGTTPTLRRYRSDSIPLPNSRRDVADCHILVESRYSQFGEEKPLYFEQSKETTPDRFAAYRDKIVHIVVEDKPEGVGCDLGWKHEWHVRDAILRGLDSEEMQNCGALSGRKLRDEDILMISDADEVPRGSVVKRLKAKWPVGGFCGWGGGWGGGRGREHLLLCCCASNLTIAAAHDACLNPSTHHAPTPKASPARSGLR